ncbi:MAG: MFS transporter, partial [Oscillospiraceae bacterium]|nr:MFS transporter [Oscillospiraceae bacterium]
MACVWALIPLYNVYNFSVCPIERLVDEGKGMSMGQLLRSKTMWTGIILMICAGSSELAMAQWASAFAESALGLAKTTGDLLGPCLFAVTMGLCRVIYGKLGGRIELTKFMAASGILCVICYLMASVSKNPLVGLIGCIMCGFSVGIMWPGTISILSKNMPAGGTAMFALLAMAGDMGGSVGPSIVGSVTDMAGGDLRSGLLAGAVFPLILTLIVLAGAGKRKDMPE